MKKYTYVFSGVITVKDNSEKEAFEQVADLVEPTMYAHNHCEYITVDDIELIDSGDE